jgi:hypothetical protein
MAKVGREISDAIKDPLDKVSKGLVELAADPDKAWGKLTDSIDKKFETMIDNVGNKIIDKIANPLGINLDVSGGEALKNGFSAIAEALSGGGTSMFSVGNNKIVKKGNTNNEKVE